MNFIAKRNPKKAPSARRVNRTVWTSEGLCTRGIHSLPKRKWIAESECLKVNSRWTARQCTCASFVVEKRSAASHRLLATSRCSQPELMLTGVADRCAAGGFRRFRRFRRLQAVQEVQAIQTIAGLVHAAEFAPLKLVPTLAPELVPKPIAKPIAKHQIWYQSSYPRTVFRQCERAWTRAGRTAHGACLRYAPVCTDSLSLASCRTDLRASSSASERISSSCNVFTKNGLFTKVLWKRRRRRSQGTHWRCVPSCGRACSLGMFACVMRMWYEDVLASERHNGHIGD